MSNRPIETGNELNQFGFWSCWAQPLKPAKWAYGLFSEAFQEPLFNKVVFLRPPDDPEASVGRVFEQFERKGGRPSFFVTEDRAFLPLRSAVMARGLRPADKFVTLALTGSAPSSHSGTSVREIANNEVEVWTRAYLEAFYGEQTLLGTVLPCVAKSQARRSNRMLLAVRDREVAGVTALHVSHGYVGVYCLGTTPSMRGNGVASSLLAEARSVALKEGARVILQVFAQDGVESFYIQRGFSRAYSQDVLVRGGTDS